MNERNSDQEKIPDDRKESGKLEQYQRLEQRMESGQATREDAEFSAELAAGAPLAANPVGMRKELGKGPNRSAPVPETYKADWVQERTDAEPESRSRTAEIIGWSAFVLALLSIFVLPAVLGTAAILLGLVSVYQGSRSLGAWSVLIGVVTTVTNLILVPFLG